MLVLGVSIRERIRVKVEDKIMWIVLTKISSGGQIKLAFDDPQRDFEIVREEVLMKERDSS